jgi:hypothetical protein
VFNRFPVSSRVNGKFGSKQTKNDPVCETL